MPTIVQTKIFASRDPQETETNVNAFLKTVAHEEIGSITHETKVDVLQNLIYIVKINYIKQVLPTPQIRP